MMNNSEKYEPWGQHNIAVQFLPNDYAVSSTDGLVKNAGGTA